MSGESLKPFPKSVLLVEKVTPVLLATSGRCQPLLHAVRALHTELIRGSAPCCLYLGRGASASAQQMLERRWGSRLRGTTSDCCLGLPAWLSRGGFLRSRSLSCSGCAAALLLGSRAVHHPAFYVSLAKGAEPPSCAGSCQAGGQHAAPGILLLDRNLCQ